MKIISVFFFCCWGMFSLGFSQSFPSRPTNPPCLLKHIDQDFRTRIATPAGMHTASRTATFVVDYTGYPQNVVDAFQYATDIWASVLVSPVPIKIGFYYVPFSGFLGFTLPNGVRNFSGAPQAYYWYGSALADALTGTDQNPGEVDMTIFISNTANWYFGLDGLTPAGQIDFVSVALHEIGHGLGFLSLGKEESNGDGSLGELTFADFSVPPLPVPFPDLMGVPGLFDNFVQHQGSGFLITDSLVFPNPSPALGAVFTGNDLYFTGSHALAANNQVKPRIYAPAVFDIGSSLTHLDESTYPPGDTNTLMTPFIGNAEANHSPGPIMMGVLRDLGWPLGPSTALEEMPLLGEPVAYPNPFQSEFRLRFFLKSVSEVAIHLYDIQGRLLAVQECGRLSPGQQEVFLQEDLPSGLYFYELQVGGQVFGGKLGCW